MTDTWKQAKEAASDAIAAIFRKWEAGATGPRADLDAVQAALDTLMARGFVILDWNTVRDLGLDGCVVLDDVGAAQVELP